MVASLLRLSWILVSTVVCKTATEAPLTACFIPSFCALCSDVSHEEDSHRHQTHILFVSLHGAHEKVWSHTQRVVPAPSAISFPREPCS